jgi:hypothetical protein
VQERQTRFTVGAQIQAEIFKGVMFGLTLASGTNPSVPPNWIVGSSPAGFASLHQLDTSKNH